MSDEIDVYWRGHLNADGPLLRAAWSGLGFEANLLSELGDARLFWPLEIMGLRTGFEVYFHEFGEDLEALVAEMPKLKGRDHGATFRFFGNTEGGAAIRCGGSSFKAPGRPHP